jgi:uncharacterized protein with HEPN domain
MARRRIEPVLAEILEAIEGIETHTAGKSLADFERDCPAPLPPHPAR